ncbi:hypothetical protein DAPPUDRAFT_267619 [Daphnia pulex]|uniref:Uncharacterized protein n=1 Tax=Daphnia pulex TaxID=6669 RepID=E9HWP9_DAPPU|nr:hypothetical protein DAPPUDRAFT_267619 [Daphnia pulex]|eukprot:EFX63832.1 hypothetical protein DAPPUDRAFT_267619 [Daphnia pulex]
MSTDISANTKVMNFVLVFNGLIKASCCCYYLLLIHQIPEVLFVPELRYQGVKYFTEALKYYIIKAPEYYTTTYAAPAYYTVAPKCYTTMALLYCKTTYHGRICEGKEIGRVCISDTATAIAGSEYYITTYVAPRYYTKAPECYTEATNYYTTKAPEYYTTTHHGREKVNEFSSRVSNSVTATAMHFLSPTSFFVALQVLIKGVVLLLGFESLMAGSTTGVPMSPGYGGYQTATPASNYTTTSTYATTSYYKEALKLQIITPNLCYPALLHRIPEVFFPELHYQSVEYYTIRPPSTTLLPATTSRPQLVTSQTVEHYTAHEYAPSYITTTEVANYYTEALKYYTAMVPEYCTTTYADPTYYTEALPNKNVHKEFSGTSLDFFRPKPGLQEQANPSSSAWHDSLGSKQAVGSPTMQASIRLVMKEKRDACKQRINTYSP